MLQTLTIKVGQNEQPLTVGEVVEFRTIKEKSTYVVQYVNPVPISGYWSVTMEKVNLNTLLGY